MRPQGWGKRPAHSEGQSRQTVGDFCCAGVRRAVCQRQPGPSPLGPRRLSPTGDAPMSRARVRGGAAAVMAALLVTLAAVLACWPARQGPAGLQADQPAPRKRPAEKPIPMAADLIGLEFEFGLKDEQPTKWDGEIEVSEGKVALLEAVRPPNAGAKGATFHGRSVVRMMMQQQTIVHPIFRCNLAAPASATVTVKTEQGKFSFSPADLAGGGAAEYLGGRVSVERQDPALRLTGRETEDDYPVLAKGA